MRELRNGGVVLFVAATAGMAQSLNGQVKCGTFSYPPPLNSAVYDMIEFGGSVYIAGNFTGASGNYITRFDGQTYTPLVAPLPAKATALAVFDDGTGPALFVGGSHWNFPFSSITHYGVLKWTGQAWASTGYPQANLGSGITDMVVYDDGNGPELYAGTESGYGLRRYNGSTWSEVPGNPWNALALAVFDDGGGPALYVGGHFFTAGGVSVRNLAKFKSGDWFDVGGGLTINNTFQGTVGALEMLDLGAGPRLFVGGYFNRAGTTPAFAITSWDGSEWARYPFTGYQQFTFIAGQVIHSLAAITDRQPPLLLAAAHGFATYPVPEIRGGVMAWDGERWQGVGPPLEVTANALLVRESPAGSSVLVGGQYQNYLVEWTPAPQCYANCDCSTEPPRLNVADFSCFLQRFAEGKSWANCDASTTHPILNVADFSCFLQRFAAGCE